MFFALSTLMMLVHSLLTSCSMRNLSSLSFVPLHIFLPLPFKIFCIIAGFEQFDYDVLLLLFLCIGLVEFLGSVVFIKFGKFSTFIQKIFFLASSFCWELYTEAARN